MLQYITKTRYPEIVCGGITDELIIHSMERKGQELQEALDRAIPHETQTLNASYKMPLVKCQSWPMLSKLVIKIL